MFQGGHLSLVPNIEKFGLYPLFQKDPSAGKAVSPVISGTADYKNLVSLFTYPLTNPLRCEESRSLHQYRIAYMHDL